MAEEERELVEALWPALEPPPGFAERVLAAAAAPPGPPRRARPPGRGWLWALGGAAVGAAAAAVLLLVFSRGGSPGGPSASGAGQLSALSRQTLSIGDRAVAVAEPGADLAWSIVDGAARVQQGTGAVFYRVDRGGPFAVATPLGEVEVTGTCFQVELAAAHERELRVRVFEGAVRVRNAMGGLAVRAGDAALVRAGEAPRVLLPTRLPERDEADAGDRSQRRAAAAEARVQALERALAEARDAGGTGQTPGDPPRSKFFGFDVEERRRLAARCELRYALPRHLATLDLLELDEGFGLAPHERAGVLRAMEEQRSQFVEQLRAIYGQVVGDGAEITTLSPLALKNEISIKSRKGEAEEARRHLFAEWAGRAPPPDLSARPPVERFWRLLAAAGDEFVARLEPVVGEQRARDIAGKLVKSAVVITDKPGCTGPPR